MSEREFADSRDSSAHEQLIWDYIAALPETQIQEIFGRAERKVEKIPYGMLTAGHPISAQTQAQLVQSAILRELNTRAG